MTDLLSRWSRLPRNNNICLTLTFLQRSLLQMQYYKFYSIRSLIFKTFCHSYTTAARVCDFPSNIVCVFEKSGSRSMNFDFTIGV